ncbi:response regulator [Breoghania sp. L-A4]|uniref:cell cycle histidine kinase CckA n=1 Tax=Breoghania sp. L-A4 TaxID=2304600 RepID=UPI000E35F83E|nr:response regulator [Breoghania sp. L-A4]AXS41197.1 response regulator [Breoghania sp. L-A4]
MSDIEARSPEPVIDRSERSGSIGLLVLLGLGLVAAAGGLAFMSREQAEPYVLGLLGLLAVVGVFCLFAAAIGLLRFASRQPGNPLAQAFLDSHESGALITDSSGRIIYANQAYAELTGAASAADVRAVERVFSSDPDAADAIYRLSQATRSDLKVFEEVRLPHPIGQFEGSPRWYRINVRPLETGDSAGGRHKYTVWSVADITRDRTEQESSFQELQRVINFLDHAPAGFFSADGEGRIVYLNATLADWLGHDLAQFEACSLLLSDVVRGDGAELIHSISGQPGDVKTETLDLDLVTRSGRTIPVRLLHRVPFGADGHAGESRTLVLNRSPGEEAQEALRAAEVRFARFFNNTPIAIASVDREGRIVRTNAPFVRLFGKAEPGDGSHRPIVDFVAGNGRDELANALTAAAAGQGEIAPMDIQLAGSDDDRSATFYISAVEDGEDEGEAAIVYALETTRQRALELQFAQSQKMQAIGQLAGGVAHDFNNVLTAIIGFSDLLLANHRPADPSFQDIMNIKQNANRAAGLVRQLLAFSRRQTLRPKQLELNDVLADLSILLDRLLGEKVELKVVHGRDLWPVMADLNQFEQVIVNLAVNARDAMIDGGQLTIRTSNVTREQSTTFDNTRGMPTGEYVLIEATDTGTGMSQQVMDKIFEPFFSTKDVGKGTGLGLSTVYGIIKQTGGYIYPVSTVGEGTMFRIFLPRHVVEENAVAIPADVQPEAPMTDLTGSATILLVEDEEAVRAFAARALASRGYTVHEASCGTEALEVLEAAGGEVDLVVSDVVMPEMDGPSLLRELRKTKPDLKIIFVSGYAEEAFEKNLPENEKFSFLPKPFTLKQLATAVKEALSS